MRASIKATQFLLPYCGVVTGVNVLSRPGWLSLSNMFSFSLNVLCLKKEHLWRLCTHQLCFLQHQSSCLHRIITQVRLKFTKLYINYLIYISSRKYSVLHREWVLTKDPLVDGENFMFNSYLDASYYFRYRCLHRAWVLLLERLYRKVIVLM